MIETKCSMCQTLMRVAENEYEQGDRYWFIEFSYQTFFFCSEKCQEDYAQ